MLENTLHEWIGALVVLFLVIFVLLIGRKIASRLWHGNRYPNKAVGYIFFALGERSPVAIVMLACLCLAGLTLNLTEGGRVLLWRGFTIIMTIQVAVWVACAVSRYLQDARALRGDQNRVYTVITFIGYFVNTVVWILAGMVMLSTLGIDITGFVASAGVGGVAVALAAQSFLRDFVSGFSIMLDRPFEVGDFIKVDNHRGTVEQIGVRTTWLRSFEGERLIFSNSDLMSSRIHNFGGMSKRQGLYKFEVEHDTPPDKIEQALAEIRVVIGAMPDVSLKRAHFNDITPSGIQFEALFTVDSGDYSIYLDRRQQMIKDSLRILERLGIEVVKGRVSNRPKPEANTEEWKAGWLG